MVCVEPEHGLWYYGFNDDDSIFPPECVELFSLN